MGFSFDHKTKRQAFNHAMKSYKMPVVTISIEVNGHYWIDVKEVESENNFLECLFLKKGLNDLWGWKFVSESQGFLVWDCPLDMLEGIPVQDEFWREQVKAWHKVNG